MRESEYNFVWLCFHIKSPRGLQEAYFEEKKINLLHGKNDNDPNYGRGDGEEKPYSETLCQAKSVGYVIDQNIEVKEMEELSFRYE